MVRPVNSLLGANLYFNSAQLDRFLFFSSCFWLILHYVLFTAEYLMERIPVAGKNSILSGIQPTNQMHLGNYLGAIRNWKKMQDDYNCYFMMVDLHAITVAQKAEELQNSCYFGIASYLAAGLDPHKVTLFLQSHVPAHAELGWVMTCLSYMGELNRMTQFKDKGAQQGKNIGAGLYVYPCLMAADILLYRPQFVPVGEDQKQHIELARDLAERFNHRYGKEVFRIPQPFIGSAGARVMDLQNPLAKMSKSAAVTSGVVFLNDSDKIISKKIKTAVTDSGSEVGAYENASPGIKNLLDLYAALAERPQLEIAEKFAGKSYGTLKVALADLAVATLAPIREETERRFADAAHLRQILTQGTERAEAVAKKTLAEVYEVMGFIPR
jgi:tryptophanyl-tRNA synthetase